MASLTALPLNAHGEKLTEGKVVLTKCKATQCRRMVSPASSIASCIWMALHNLATGEQMAKWESAIASPA